MTNTQKVIGVVLVLLVGILLIGSLSRGAKSLGGVYHLVEESFEGGIDLTGDGDLEVDNTIVINSSGAFVGASAPTTLTVGTGGTAIDLIACSSATSWNPGAVSSSTVASTSVTVAGFTLGDILVASLATSTQGLGLFVSASTTGAAVVTLVNPARDAAAVDLATTTVRVCAISN